MGQTPSEVDCRYEVLNGNPGVHIELLSRSEFRLFKLGREHDAMARTPEGRIGEIQRIVGERGRYVVVVQNAPGASPAEILLHVATSPAVAQVLSPRRRLTVIAISFAFFFVTVAWSGRKLLRAMRL